MEGFDIDRQRRVIFNNDGDILEYPVTTPDNVEQVLRKEVFQPLVDTHVDSLFWCLGLNGVRYKTVNSEFQSTPILQELLKRGIDPAKLVLRLAGEYGLECFFSLRMNDGHDVGDASLMVALKRDHPEYILPPLKRKPNEWFRPWMGLDKAFNYACEPVRESKYKIVKEVCHNYSVDGFELDFMRHPRYFAEGEERKNAHLLTDLIRRIRTTMDNTQEKQGRRLGLAVRVPSSVERAECLGLDVTAWMQEKLVDIVTVSTMDASMDLDVESYLKYRSDTCRIYAFTEAYCWYDQYPIQLPALKEWRGRCYDFWQRGVNGMYLWNANYQSQVDPDWSYQELKEIGDPKILARLDKTYRVFNVWHVPRSLVDPDPQLPREISIKEDSPTGVRFSIGDNPEIVTFQANLQLELDERCYLDKFNVWLNGKPLDFETARKKPRISTASDAGSEWVTFYGVEKSLQRGYNTVEIVATNCHPSKNKPRQILGLKLFVRYSENAC